jgi:hypothetical protein
MVKDPEEARAYQKCEAETCHSAAEHAASAEVRRAYLELEQGWLQLMGGTAEEAPPKPEKSDHHRRIRRPRPRR